MDVIIRPETRSDHDAAAEVNRLAFGGEAEPALVEGLGAGGHVRLSLVAEAGGKVVGHILFSRIKIETDRGTLECGAAPMAVHPSVQRRGIGIAAGRGGPARLLKGLWRTGSSSVHGHPGFYPRFGFSAKHGRAAGITVFGQGVDGRLLAGSVLAPVTGQVRYPPPFDLVSPISGRGRR